MLQEIIQLKDSVIELEKRRMRFTNAALKEFSYDENVRFDKIRQIITKEKNTLDLLMMKLNVERERLPRSNKEFELKLIKVADNETYKNVSHNLDIANKNLLRHNDCLLKFAEKMMQALEICEENISKLMSKNIGSTEDPVPFFKEANEWLTNAATCLKNAYESIEILVRSLETSNLPNINYKL